MFNPNHLKITLLLLTSSIAAQDFGSLEGKPAKARQFVAYAAEPQVVPAGKQATLLLRFHVNDGYHVNSHTPKSELLIPTLLALEPAPGVTLTPIHYPAGTAYALPQDPSDKLDVYTGDFTVQVPVIASAGPHELKATLRYQACDQAACYPPKTLLLTILFTAR